MKKEFYIQNNSNKPLKNLDINSLNTIRLWTVFLRIPVYILIVFRLKISNILIIIQSYNLSNLFHMTLSEKGPFFL